MKKLFTFLALMLCYVGMAGAQTEVTCSRTLEFSSTPTVYTLTPAESEYVTVTQYDGAGSTGKGKGLWYLTTTATTINAVCYRSLYNGATLTQYEDAVYAGLKIEIADGYKLNASNITSKLAVGQNFTYRIILTDGSSVIYQSDDFTVENYAQTTATNLDKSFDLENKSLTGTVYLRIHYWYGGGQSKYIAPLELSLKGTIEEDSRTKYTVVTSAEPTNGGSVSPSGENQFVEGSDVVLTATPNIGYKFVKWTVDGVEYNDNPYTIENLSSDHTAEALFETLPKITFAVGDGLGSAPSAGYAEIGDKYTLPNALMLVKEGCSLIGWSDGTTTYIIGEEITVDGDITLTPVFEKNKSALGDESVEVDWTFAKANGAPEFAVEGKVGYYGKPVTVNGKEITAIMTVNTTTGIAITDVRGKWNNTSYSNCAQVNPGTMFTIPAVKGMTVVYTITQGSAKAADVTFNGEEGTAENKTITYIYEGKDATIDIVAVTTGLYPSGIKVTYPIEEKSLTTTDTDFYGLYLPYQTSVPEGITAYTGALSNDHTTLTLTKVEGEIPSNTAVLVKSNAVGTYTFNVSNEETADAIANNSLQGVTVETAVADLAEEGKTVLTLGVADDGIVAFRKPAAETIKANKVYLLVDAASSAKIRIVEGETTGIEENYEFGINNSDEATYDLSGRKVANPAKGLYIKSGKKFIVK